MRWGEAVIFAGGKSSRMGEDKALLPFGGYGTLAEYQYRRLLPLFEHVSLSAKGDKFPFSAPLILDRDSEQSSPMVALASILSAIKGDTVFVLSVDMPFVDAALIEKLFAAARLHPDASAIVARSPEGTEPLCAIYRTTLLPRVEDLLRRGEHRMHTLIKNISSVEVLCDRETPFANLNTPEDYRRYHDRRR